MHQLIDTHSRQEPRPATSGSDRQPLTLVGLEHWFSTADAGSTVAYFRGYLSLDRGTGSRLGKGAAEELDRVASALMAMAEAGNVHLVQRRHGSCDYTCIAVMGAGSRRVSRRLIQESAS